EFVVDVCPPMLVDFDKLRVCRKPFAYERCAIIGQLAGNHRQVDRRMVVPADIQQRGERGFHHIGIVVPEKESVLPAGVLETAEGIGDRTLESSHAATFPVVIARSSAVRATPFVFSETPPGRGELRLRTMRCASVSGVRSMPSSISTAPSSCSLRARV